MSKQKSKKLSNIRRQLNSARQGEIKSIFELARFYELGHYVDQDFEQAQSYYDQVLSFVDNCYFKLGEMKLFQYRQFEKIKVKFEPSLTVFVGDNGLGKTSILDAIAQSLRWFMVNVKHENASSTLPSETDIKVGDPYDYTYIDCQYEIESKQVFQHIVAKAKTSYHQSVDSEHIQIKLLGNIFRFAHAKKEPFNLPIVAYYTIARSDEVKNTDFKTADAKADQQAWSQFDGYNGALDKGTNFTDFLSWFIRFDKMQSNVDKPLSTKKIYEQELADYQLELANADGAFREFLIQKIEEKQQQIHELDQQLSHQGSKTYAELLLKVKTAIQTFIPEIKDISIEYTINEVDMVLNKSGVKISAKQLSQGEKSLMALVGDLARRLIMLNPARENPLDGGGIVLIDEIDLHLHPSWQQTVIGKLKHTFQNIQFILTTHSPQVLSTIAKSQIRKLACNSADNNVVIDELDSETYAFPSSDVMESVMDVKPIADLPELKQLEEYRQLLEQGDIHDNEVKQQLKELKEALDSILEVNHPELIKLEILRRRREWLG